MKFGFAVCAFGLITSCFAAPTQAQQTCRIASSSSSTLQINIAQPTSIEQLVIDVFQIADVAQKFDAAALHGHTHPLAVMVSTFIQHFHIEPGYVQVATSAFCPAPKRVEVLLGYTSRKIILVREAANNSCISDQLKAHQAKHAHAEDQLISTFVIENKQSFAALFRKLKEDSRPAETSHAAQAQFERSVKLFLSDAAKALRIESDKLHEQIDNEAELNKLQAACDGQLGDLSKRVAAAFDPKS